MSRGLRVEAAGISTTLQDQGRTGYQRYGIPVGGALDRMALAAANTVVGNAAGMATLECLYQGPALRVTSDSVRVAVAGDGAQLEICDRRGSRRTVAGMESARVKKGELIFIHQKGPSISAYLAVEGGFAVPAVLGSQSTFARGGLGGYEGRPLRTGDVLPTARTRAPIRPEVRLGGVTLSPRHVVRIMPGPQIKSFRKRDVERLVASAYKISAACDRMGMRLEGATLSHRRSADIVSEAILAGSVQVPGDGQPIVLLADCQTTGGYAKAAVVISADLPLLGRLGAGQDVSFRWCRIEEARAAQRALTLEIASWQDRLEVVDDGLARRQLYTSNLISGAWDALCA